MAALTYVLYDVQPNDSSNGVTVGFKGRKELETVPPFELVGSVGLRASQVYVAKLALVEAESVGSARETYWEAFGNKGGVVGSCLKTNLTFVSG